MKDGPILLKLTEFDNSGKVVYRRLTNIKKYQLFKQDDGTYRFSVIWNYRDLWMCYRVTQEFVNKLHSKFEILDGLKKKEE